MVATLPRFVVISTSAGNLDLQLIRRFSSLGTAPRSSPCCSRRRCRRASAKSTAAELFSASPRRKPVDAHEQHLKAIEQHLTKTHALPLTADDLAGLEAVYQAFYSNGFYVRSNPSYADLMTATDATGVSRSYLATDEGFQFLKDLESRNLVVPVVGTSGAEGDSRDRDVSQGAGATVAAFYSRTWSNTLSGRQMGRVLPQRSDPAARFRQHVHPVLEWRGGSARWGICVESGRRSPAKT
jgi:hypothetical protein